METLNTFLRIATGMNVVAKALARAEPLIQKGPMLVYSTADWNAVQRRLGVQKAGAIVERGVRQLIVAGGETSGACVT